jgi:hypothetical protein
LRDAFELQREIVETFVDGGEIFADRALVVVKVSVWPVFLPHAVHRSLEQ